MAFPVEAIQSSAQVLDGFERSPYGLGAGRRIQAPVLEPKQCAGMTAVALHALDFDAIEMRRVLRDQCNELIVARFRRSPCGMVFVLCGEREGRYTSTWLQRNFALSTLRMEFCRYVVFFLACSHKSDKE